MRLYRFVRTERTLTGHDLCPDRRTRNDLIMNCFFPAQVRLLATSLGFDAKGELGFAENSTFTVH